MNATDDVIAQAARAIAPHFREHGLRWAVIDGKPGTFIPGEAEIALTLREMVSDVRPGGRIYSGHLIVEWPFDDAEDDGEGDDVLATPGPIRILFDLAEIEPAS